MRPNLLSLTLLAIPTLVATLAASPALAQDGPTSPESDGIYLELLDGPPLATLDEALAATGAGDHDRAAIGYQALVDLACGEGRDRLVILREAPRGLPGALLEEPSAGRDGRGFPPHGQEPLSSETAYVSLPVALRARLAALPPAGLRAYRRLVDARAGALAQAAIATRDRDRLQEVHRRYLFSSRGAEAALVQGDLALEAGDLIVACSVFEAAALVPDAPPQIEARRRAARARLAEEDARAARDAHAPSRAPRTHVLHVAGFDEGENVAGAIECPPILLADGLAVARPGKVILARDLGGDSPGGPVVRMLPASPMPVLTPRTGPFTLGGASAYGLLAVSIEHARGLAGSDADDAHAGAAPAQRPAGAPAPGGAPALRPGQRPAAAVPPDATQRGGVFGDAFDLFVFDLARGDKLVFTTAEATAFGAAHAEWLSGVEWTARPIIGPGLIFGAAAGRTGEPEVHIAAFELRGDARPRIRWKSFLCARGFMGTTEEFGDGPPLEPTIARAGRVLLVDAGVGLHAALDAASGEVLWAVRRATPSRDGRGVRTVLRGFPEESYQPVTRPTDAPIVVVGRARAPKPGGTRGTGGTGTGTDAGARDIVVFAPRAPGPASIVALDVATGETAWMLAAEEGAFPVADAGGGRLAIVEDGALSLVEAATGRRLGLPLLLPGRDPEARARSEGIGRGAASAGRLLVPVAPHVLVVRIEEDSCPGGGNPLPTLPAEGSPGASPGGPRLLLERAIAGVAGSCVAPAALADGAALADSEGVLVWGLDRPGGPSGTAAWEDVIGVAEAYDASCPPDVPARLRAIANGADLASILEEEDGDSPGTDEEGAGLIEDAARGTVRAPLVTVPRGPVRVSLVLERATGRLTLEVEEAPDVPGARRPPIDPDE